MAEDNCKVCRFYLGHDLGSCRRYPDFKSKLLAVRVAVLARSSQLEKDTVTVNAPAWAGNSIPFVMHNLDGSTGSTSVIANDWHHYRYRVYESTVPMRNMIWGSTS